MASPPHTRYHVKIAYLSSSTIPSRAANSIHVMKMCNAFAKHGNIVKLLTLRKTQKELDVDCVYSFYDVEPQFEIKELPWFQIPGRAFVTGFISGIEAGLFDADLAYGRFLHGCFFAAVMGLPVVYEAHTPITGSYATRRTFAKMLRQPAFEQLVVISDALREWFLDEYPTLAGKIIVAPDAADPISEPINDDAVERNCTLEDHRDGCLQVGYIGHFYPGKGVGLIAKLAARCPWADFHLVGGTRKELKRWQKRLGQRANVTMYGFLSPADAERIRCQCDVLLAPYQRRVEGYGKGNTDIARWMSPLKIFEYMASGNAFVSSRLPVLKEILTHRHNALLCEPDDVKQWSDALRELAENDNLRRRLGATACREFEEHYTWTARARRVIPEALLSQSSLEKHSA